MPVFQVLSRTAQLSTPPKKRTRHFPSQWYVVARALVSGLVGGAIFTLLARFGPTVFFLLPVLVSLSWGQPQRYDIIKLLHSTPVYLLLTICLTFIYFGVVIGGNCSHTRVTMYLILFLSRPHSPGSTPRFHSPLHPHCKLRHIPLPGCVST